MIREIHLKGFKRYRDERLPAAPLTLLTGLNSGGKSSVMQGLFLLHHAARSAVDLGAGAGAVALNAPGFTLGDLRSVCNESSGGQTFTLGLTTRTTAVEWTLGSEDAPPTSLAVPVASVLLNGALCHEAPLSFAPASLHQDEGAQALLDSLARLQFVPADRLGPAETYPLDDPARHATPGPRAERTFGNLVWRERDPIPVPALRHPVEAPATVRHQVEAWLSDLFPGATIEPRQVPHANLLTLGIRTSEEMGFHRPHNVGFGVTYVLPIVLALLTAKVGDVVLLENPEAHLHPRAQAKIARLCARAAGVGIQVVVETHSDHILNGVRVAVHAGQIAPEDVSILFFSGPRADAGSIFTPIRVDRRGVLDAWPPGFFDETDVLLDRLLEPVRLA